MTLTFDFKLNSLKVAFCCFLVFVFRFVRALCGWLVRFLDERKAETKIETQGERKKEFVSKEMRKKSFSCFKSKDGNFDGLSRVLSPFTHSYFSFQNQLTGSVQRNCGAPSVRLLLPATFIVSTVIFT